MSERVWSATFLVLILAAARVEATRENGGFCIRRFEGRKVFGNITKYIKMGASSNFGNMFSVLGASLFLPRLQIGWRTH